MAQIPRQQSDAERLKSLGPTRQPVEALKSPNGLLRAVSDFIQRISNFLRRSTSNFMQNLRSLFSRSKKVSRSKKGKDTSGDLAALAKRPVVPPQVATSPSGSPPMAQGALTDLLSQPQAAEASPLAKPPSGSPQPPVAPADPLAAPPPARLPSGSSPMAQGALADLLSQLSAAEERLAAPPPVRPDLPMESSDVAMAFNPHDAKIWEDAPIYVDADVPEGEQSVAMPAPQTRLHAATESPAPTLPPILPAIETPAAAGLPAPTLPPRLPATEIPAPPPALLEAAKPLSSLVTRLEAFQPTIIPPAERRFDASDARSWGDEPAGTAETPDEKEEVQTRRSPGQ